MGIENWLRRIVREEVARALGVPAGRVPLDDRPAGRLSDLVTMTEVLVEDMHRVRKAVEPAAGHLHRPGGQSADLVGAVVRLGESFDRLAQSFDGLGELPGGLIGRQITGHAGLSGCSGSCSRGVDERHETSPSVGASDTPTVGERPVAGDGSAPATEPAEGGDR